MKKLVLKSSSTQSGVELTSQLSTSPSTASARELPRLPGTGAEVVTIAGLMNAKGWKTSLYTRDAALKGGGAASGEPGCCPFGNARVFPARSAKQSQQR